jgi:hypothetical protein
MQAPTCEARIMLTSRRGRGRLVINTMYVCSLLLTCNPHNQYTGTANVSPQVVGMAAKPNMILIDNLPCDVLMF